MPAYGGIPMFGRSVKCSMQMNPPAEQLNAFFGVNGTQRLFGGLRGRVFLVDGLLLGATIFDLSDAELLILSYNDGIGRVFEDSYGRQWPSTVFRDYQPQGRIMYDARGYYQVYKAVYHCLAG